MTALPSAIMESVASRGMGFDGVPFDSAVRRLASGIAAGFRAREPRRRERRELLEMFGGPYVTTPRALPLNLMNQMIVSITANVLAADPTAEVTAKDPGATRGYAEILSRFLTQRLVELDYRSIESLVLVDGLTMEGVVKVGTASAGYSIEIEGELIDPGKSYICRVSPDRYFIDPAAHSFHERLYQGHGYETNRAVISAVLSGEEIDRLPKWSERGGRELEAATLGVAGSNRGDLDEFVTMYALIDVHVSAGVLSREPLVITLPGDPYNVDMMLRQSGDSPVIRVMEYEGPERGDYAVLGFNPIPDTTVFAAPAGIVRDLAEMAGMLAKHNADADLTFRDLTLVSEDVTDPEYQAVRGARNQAMVRVRNPGAYVNAKMGGSTDGAQSSEARYMSHFSRMSGSDMMSGNPVNRASGGGDVTATEVQEISGRLGVILDGLERTVYAHGDEVLAKLAWHETRSPMLDATVALMSAGIPVPMRLTREDARENEAFEQHFTIQRGSMRRMSPEMKSKQIQQWAASQPIVAAQLAQLYGPGFDIMGFLRLTARGFIDAADLQTIMPDPKAAAEFIAYANLVAQMGAPTAPGAGGEGGEPIRRPGMPGTDSMPGGNRTGAASENFDPRKNTERTMSAIGAGGATM